jgi:hypothetical protein
MKCLEYEEYTNTASHLLRERLLGGTTLLDFSKGVCSLEKDVRSGRKGVGKEEEEDGVMVGSEVLFSPSVNIFQSSSTELKNVQREDSLLYSKSSGGEKKMLEEGASEKKSFQPVSFFSNFNFLGSLLIYFIMLLYPYSRISHYQRFCFC